MQHVVRALAHRGGLATLHELRSSGVGAREVQRAAEHGMVRRVSRGWYALPDADPRLVAAIRAGGSLGCVSGTTFHGLWEPPGRGALHLSRAHGAHAPASAQASAAPQIVHWTAPLGRDASHGVLPLLMCLAQMLGCLAPDHAFAVVESGLNRGLVTARDVRALADGATRTGAAVLELVGTDAESGTESLFRCRMHLLGVSMQSQVEVGGVGRVDFVIGDRLIIEIDSEAHHGGAEQRRRDLARDAIAVGLGFVVLRFDYRQVLSDWETVESTVLAVIRRREHVRRA